METPTLYDELELHKRCTSDEIKQKYRILAQIHHPDKGGDEEKFKRIKLAYEILSDPKKREHYDSTGEHYDEAETNNEALSRLCEMVSHFTQQINPDGDDLIARLKIEVYQAQHHTNNTIIESNNIIRKLDIISNKIRLKKEGENLLKSFVETKISQAQLELVKHERSLLVFKKMLEILEDYHFSNDEWKLLIQ